MPPKCFELSHLRQKSGANFKVAPNFAFSYTMQWIQPGPSRQGMGIMRSGVMDTVLHSGDAWDSMS